jgi:hypothetical protein
MANMLSPEVALYSCITCVQNAFIQGVLKVKGQGRKLGLLRDQGLSYPLVTAGYSPSVRPTIPSQILSLKRTSSFLDF